MIMIIDGDNSPGTNVKKLGLLEKSDKVIIYYASDNGFFTKENNRIPLIESTRCEVSFKCVPAGNCAVDLAIAMDSTQLIQAMPAGVLILVSKDKHFKTILNLLKSSFQDWYIAVASDVEEAIRNYKVIEANSLDEFHKWLVHMFGERNGNEVYGRIEELFAKQKKQHVIKEQLFNKLYSDIMRVCHNSK